MKLKPLIARSCFISENQMAIVARDGIIAVSWGAIGDRGSRIEDRGSRVKDRASGKIAKTKTANSNIKMEMI